MVEWAGELMERRWGRAAKGGLRPVNGPFGHTAFLLVAQRRQAASKGKGASEGEGTGEGEGASEASLATAAAEPPPAGQQSSAASAGRAFEHRPSMATAWRTIIWSWLHGRR